MCPDNVQANPGTGGARFATREVTYSGDATTHVTVTALAAFAGSDDAKTVADIAGDASNGLDVDVTRLPTLVAGTAIIGKVGIDQTTPGTTNAVSAVLTAGSAVIGHVIVDSGGGGGTQYVEDAPAASDPTGTVPILVRKDTLAAITSTDGDNIAARGTNKGEAYTHDADLLVAVNAVTTAIGTSSVTVGAGAVDATTGRITLASDDPAVVSLQLIDDAIKADDAAFTPATTKVLMAGFEADESSTDSVDEGDAGAARMTLDRKQIVTIQPHTAGGLTTYHLVSAATTNLVVIKASAGQVYGWYLYNSNAAARKLVFHNSASTPTAGASVFFTLVVPPTSGANVSFPNGIAFSTGIAISTVTELADNGTTAVALADLVINVWYA